MFNRPAYATYVPDWYAHEYALFVSCASEPTLLPGPPDLDDPNLKPIWVCPTDVTHPEPVIRGLQIVKWDLTPKEQHLVLAAEGPWRQKCRQLEDRLLALETEKKENAARAALESLTPAQREALRQLKGSDLEDILDEGVDEDDYEDDDY